MVQQVVVCARNKTSHMGNGSSVSTSVTSKQELADELTKLSSAIKGEGGEPTEEQKRALANSMRQLAAQVEGTAAGGKQGGTDPLVADNHEDEKFDFDLPVSSKKIPAAALPPVPSSEQLNEWLKDVTVKSDPEDNKHVLRIIKGLELSQGTHTFDRCAFSGTVLLLKTAKATFTRCRFSNGSECLMLADSSEAYLEQCELTHGSDIGIEAGGNSSVKAIACRIVQAGRRGVYVMRAASATIHGCVIEGCGAAFASNMDMIQSHKYERSLTMAEVAKRVKAVCGYETHQHIDALKLPLKDSRDVYSNALRVVREADAAGLDAIIHIPDLDGGSDLLQQSAELDVLLEEAQKAQSILKETVAPGTRWARTVMSSEWAQKVNSMFGDKADKVPRTV